MTPFLSRTKRTSFLVIIICILFCSFTLSPERKDIDPFVTICKNSDAYLLHSYTDVTYSSSFFGYKKYVSNDTKLVVNTTKGVENYAFLDLSEYESNHLQSIKIRTLKADGSIVELDSTSVFQRESRKEKFGAIHYPIPGVEPGDTIEASYLYYENLKTYELKDYVNLYTNVPSFNSQYTIKAPPQLNIRYKPYNNFPKPVIVANDTMVYLQFSMDKIEGLEINEHHCIPCEKPYLYYSMEGDVNEIRTWKNVYNEEFNFLTQPMVIDREKVSFYKRWKRNIIAEAQDSSKYHQFELLHSEIVRNFSIEPAKKEEFIKSIGYFLENERFDPISIRRFYRKILEDLEIEYWAVFARTKQNGTIDKHYIRKGEFDHIFFAFEDEKGSLRFLYPHDEFYQYQVDEIPTSLYGTDAILVKPFLLEKLKKRDKVISKNLELATVDSVAVAEITLPAMGATHNYLRQVVSSDIDVSTKKATLRYRFKVSGGLSTELRNFYNMLGNDEDASNFYDALEEYEGVDNTLQIDSIISSIQDVKRPFALNVSAKGLLNNAVTYINDSLVSVSIDKLITHNVLEHIDNYNELNYYLNYSYSDMLLMYLNFSSDVEVLGLDDVNVDYTNDFSEYIFKIKQSKKNQIQLQSDYKILTDLIPKEKLSELTDLNEQVRKIKGTRLIVKLKNSVE